MGFDFEEEEGEERALSKVRERASVIYNKGDFNYSFRFRAGNFDHFEFGQILTVGPKLGIR